MTGAVLDPSVLVAGLIGNPGAAPGVLRAAWRERRFTLIVSPKLIEELRGVLARPKFDRWASQGRATAYINLIETIAESHPDPPNPTRELRDPDDDYLVALARSTGTGTIVSVDLDLLDANLDSLTVCRPRAFLEMLEQEQPQQ